MTSPYSFIISEADLTQGALNRPGTVRVDKVFTLEKSLIVKTFGRVKDRTLDRIRAALGELTKPNA